MYDFVINPITGNLQLVSKINPSEVEIPNVIQEKQKIIQCKSNSVYVVTSDTLQEFIIPTQNKENDFIKIFGRSDFGWRLFIPEGQQIVFPHTFTTAENPYTVRSQLHQYDYIHLTYLYDSWCAENVSKVVLVELYNV